MSVPKMVIAVDVDGTLYDGVDVAPEAIEALQDAHGEGHAVVIVTGRRWEELGHVVPAILPLTDRVICEEGGVMVTVATGELTMLADPVEPALVAALQDAGVPSLDIGHVVVGAPSAWCDVVTAIRDKLGSRRLIITNKASIALTPAGCDKGTGLRAALHDLGLDDRPVLAIGDAANDLPMFAVAT